MYVMFCGMYWRKLYSEIAIILEMICYFITLFKGLFVVFFCITFTSTFEMFYDIHRNLWMKQIKSLLSNFCFC